MPKENDTDSSNSCQTDIIKSVEQNGHAKLGVEQNKAYLSGDLKCHKCSYVPEDINDLKKHVNEQHIKMDWSFGLIRDISNPDSKLEEDDEIVVMKDKFPKARFHYLILPKIDIDNLGQLTKEHLQLLRHMDSTAKKYVNKHKGNEFQIGYHAIPHMRRLHLHVISTDFISPSLKTKHHWNIFTSPYFIPSSDIIKSIEQNGQIQINVDQYKAYLSRELKCHKCSYAPVDIQDLKKHITKHVKVNLAQRLSSLKL